VRPIITAEVDPDAMAGVRLWVIGLLIGIDLIFYGLAWIAIALGLHCGA
jgi:uncharacterized membrane protein HdeD (DUF308 family)